MSHRSQKVSAALVVQDDASTLARALESLRWVDEIVIVDRGSRDETLAIARRYTERIFFHPSEDPAVLRTFAVSMASHPWVLALLPHEWVDEMLAHKIDGLLLSVNAEQGARIPVQTIWQGERLRLPGQTRLEQRLFRRDSAVYVEDGDDFDASGGFETEGKQVTLDAPIYAEPAQTLAQWMTRIRRRADRRAGFWVEGGNWRRLAHPGAWSLMNGFRRAMSRVFFWQGGMWQGVAGVMVAVFDGLEDLFARLRARELVKGVPTSTGGAS